MDINDILMVSGRIQLEKVVELGDVESHDHKHVLQTLPRKWGKLLLLSLVVLVFGCIVHSW